MRVLKGAMLAVSMLISVQLMAQEVRYLSVSGTLTEKSKATYFEVIEVQEDSTAIGNQYTLDSLKVRTAHYYNFHPDQVTFISHGPYKQWYKNGQLAEEGVYENNKLNGKQTSWYETGEISYIKKYSSSMKPDTLQGFYKNGTLRRIEVYDAGTLIIGELYTINGKKILPFYPHEEMPKFDGGEAALFRFLSSTLKYPNSAVKENISGTVYITFVVDKKGKLKDIDVIKSVHPELDAETLRVVNIMPKWIAGKKEGRKVDVRYNLPVKFTLK